MRIRARDIVALAACLGLATACQTPPLPADDSGVPAHCHPLAPDHEHCLLPWPSSYFLRQDDDSATGYRVNYPAKAMPANKKGLAVDPTRWNLLDGFSPGSQPIVAFPGGVSREGLPPQDDLASSVGEASLIWVIEADTGARVPLFAEVDANAPPGEGALLIRPMRPLRFDTRHLVVLREGLKDASGAPLTPPAAFRRLRDGEAVADLRLVAEGQRLAPVFALLRQQDLPLEQVVFAWDFHTASEQAVTGPLIGMVDEALSHLPTDGPVFEVIAAEDLDPDESPDALRKISGKLAVPSFLASDDPDAWLGLDATGRPVYRGEQRFDFFVNIPRCAATATAPLPVLVLGHGLFGAPETMVGSSSHRALAERLCLVAIGIRWIGLSTLDVAAAGNVAIDFSGLPRITDRLHQAQVNAQVLVELVRGELFAHPDLQVNGKQLSDGETIYYLGISLGGIQGVTFAALNQRIERFALHVGGGLWALMMGRSSNFAVLATLLELAYERPTDRALLLAMSQSLWDGTDPINYARYVREAPLPGHAPKRVAYSESRHDEQVPNLASRVVIRALGLPLMTPKVEAVYGVEEQAGPLEAAYVQWDVDTPLIPPAANIPAETPPDDVSAHYGVRRLESFIRQLELLFRPDGLVEHTCDGPCGKE